MKRMVCFLLVFLLALPALGETVQDQALAFIRAAGIGADSVTRIDHEVIVNLPGGGTAEYAVTQIAGLVARRIVPQVSEGDVKARAERFGLIRFGSRLDVYLPVGVKPCVRVGQTMVAGETPLAHLS